MAHVHGGTPYRPDARFAVTAVTGDPVAEWCDRCKAYTLVCTPLYFLTLGGITIARPLAMCSVCDDD